MTGNDLLTSPRGRAEQLGLPIPDSRHAVSMALPTWADVVGYEEKDARVLNRITVGYPRFLIHPDIRALAARVVPGQAGLPFPSQKTARECAEYVEQKADFTCKLVPAGEFTVVATSAEGMAAMEKFWQHAGTGLSTRAASAYLKSEAGFSRRSQASDLLRQRLAEWYDCGTENVFLYVSGMAAFFAAQKAMQVRADGGPTMQLGFPYVDSLKVQQEFGSEVTLLHQLDDLPKQVASKLKVRRYAACFMEIPGNPMLGTPALDPLVPHLREHDVPLVVDDTVATAYNIDLRERADLVITSLTKFPAGSGDVLGGALIIRPESRYAGELQRIITSDYEDLLWDDDARVLEVNSRDFFLRMPKHNSGGRLLAERLREHPAVAKVYYPLWEQAKAYDSVRRPSGGYGALISILLRNAESNSARFYDALDLSKGPSLGTIFTLVCPFAQLAHYRELDWAESCGVSRHLIRFSVGLEDPDIIWGRVKSSLDQL